MNTTLLEGAVGDSARKKVPQMVLSLSKGTLEMVPKLFHQGAAAPEDAAEDAIIGTVPC